MNKNKMLIGIVIIVIVAGVVGILLSINSKKNITLDIFEEKAKAQGFSIGEIDNSITQNKKVTGTKMAISSDYTYFVEMYVFEDQDSAKEFYSELKQGFENKKQEGDTAKENKKNDSEMYTLKSNEKSMYVKRIGNVIISYNVNEENEKKVKEFINSL